MSTETVPHGWIARKMGFSIAGVSLIRSGKRVPSFSTMEIIEREFGWSVVNQVRARHHYASAFEKKMQAAYNREQKEAKKDGSGPQVEGR